MPDTALTLDATADIPDIDALYRPTHDEVGRQRFVSALRKHVLVDKAAEMKSAYEATAARHGITTRFAAPCFRI
jgi:hypothetical protein